MSSPVETVLERLQLHARARADQVAFRFLGDGENETDSLTFAGLSERARRVARNLHAAPGERVLLLLPQDLQFVTAFFGCLIAGTVPVPAAVPQGRREPTTLRAIVRNARPSLVLTTRKIKAVLEAPLATSTTVTWQCLDDMQDDGGDRASALVSAESLAFLQYTSGSTGTPKGVMVTHANLAHNVRMISEAFAVSDSTIAGGWLPLYHDMGLIGLVIAPVYLGLTSVLMPAMFFLQKPVRWLQMISRYQITVSGAPNFAYDICVDRIEEAQRAGLDLRHWRLAFNGAEPLRAATIERFYRAFMPHGLRADAMYACYGMAEATLFIAGGVCRHGSVSREVDSVALQRGRAEPAAEEQRKTRLVSCDHVPAHTTIAIVDPATLSTLGDGSVGEIWVRGKSVAQGYFEDAEQTAQVFHARVVQNDGGPFLRSGDLGFTDNGTLYVTGRLKDMLIIRGRNYYPQDIERTAEECSKCLQTGGGAAFAVEVEGEERLVVVHELTRAGLRAAQRDIALDIQAGIAAEYGIQVHRIVLVPPGAMPRTSSGKVRRSACRELFERNELNIQYSFPGAPGSDIS